MVIVSDDMPSDDWRTRPSLRAQLALLDFNVANDVVARTESQFARLQRTPSSLTYEVARKGRRIYERS